MDLYCPQNLVNSHVLVVLTIFTNAMSQFFKITLVISWVAQVMDVFTSVSIVLLDCNG